MRQLQHAPVLALQVFINQASAGPNVEYALARTQKIRKRDARRKLERIQDVRLDHAE